MFRKMRLASPVRKTVRSRCGSCSLVPRPQTTWVSGWVVRAPPAEAHRHVATRAQCHHRPRLNDLCWIDQLQLKSLRDDREQQCRFELREAATDAHALPATKRHVRKAWQLFGEAVGPAFRSEHFRLVEEALVAVDDPGHDQDR